MNKKILFIILGVVVIGAAFYIYSFRSGSSKHLRLVPANASALVTFNLKKLTDKADFNGKFKETKLYKTMLSKSKELKETDGMGLLMSEILKNPLDNGLDVFSDMYVFVQNNAEDKNIGVVMDVKDKKDFAAFIGKIPGLAKNMHDEKGYQVFSHGNDYFAWNENGLLILETSNSYGDEKKQEIIKMFNILMVQDKKNSMAENKEFKQYSDNKHDISLFLNYGELMNTYSKMTANNPMVKKLMDNYKGIYISGGISFENDKIAMSSKTHGDAKAIEKINYLNKKGVDNKALQYITNDKVYALFSMSLDIPKIISMFADEKSMMQSLEQTAMGMGLTVKELESVFSGEITMALVDIIEMESKNHSYKMNEATGEIEMVEEIAKQPMPVFTLNMGIKDRANYDKLMKNIPIAVINGMRKFPLGYIPTFYAIETEYGLTFTNDSTLGAGIVTNKKTMKEPNAEVAGLMTGKPSAAYFNLNLNNYPAAVSDYFSRMAGEKSFSYFKDYMSLFNDMKGTGDVDGASFEINLVKGEGNSLFRLLKQFDTLPLEEL